MRKHMPRLRLPVNIVTVFFALFLIYIMGQLVRSFFQVKVQTFEVIEAPLSSDFTLRGVTLHDETVVYAETAGYPVFVKDEGEKISVNEKIGVITAEEPQPKKATVEEDKTVTTAISNADLQVIFKSFQDFSRQYDSSSFTSVYKLRSAVGNQLHSASASTDLSDDLLKSGTALTSKGYGMISFLIDGFEGRTIDELDARWFDGSSGTLGTADGKREVGDPLYKVIHSDRWQIVAPLTDAQVSALRGPQLNADDFDTGPLRVRIAFVKDYQEANADLEIVNKEGKNYAVFTLYHSLFRYIEDRKLDFTVKMGAQTGLKIPNSALVYKEFYTIPKDHAIADGNMTISLVIRHDNTDEARRLVVYGGNETEYYIAMDDLTTGDVIIKPNSQEQYTVGATRFLDGVYDISVGYAIFKQVKILDKNDEYSIVDAATSYGLKQYDLIALSAASIGENDYVH
ncbi:MAG: HlyD family efflux transporter periplasmic adaptor subunit [Eubacteriales bacterium]|nr:HlyD family efflux transporter periplasmic adaptor subunit [Eubacteriales bacterium]